MFWIGHCYGLLWTLHCPQGRDCKVTMIRPLLFHGIHTDLIERPGATIVDRQSDVYLLDFKVICCMFTWTDFIYVELYISTRSVGAQAPYRAIGSAGVTVRARVNNYCHCCISTYVCLHWIKGILCGYAIGSGRHHSGSQGPGPIDHKVFLWYQNVLFLMFNTWFHKSWRGIFY